MYAERERAALQQLALKTFADRKATPADRAAARQRLEADPATLTRLTLDELHTLRCLLRKAKGEPAPMPPTIRPPAVCERCTGLDSKALDDLREVMRDERQEGDAARATSATSSTYNIALKPDHDEDEQDDPDRVHAITL